eukprot:3029644-Amphidinium_carterae.2
MPPSLRHASRQRLGLMFERVVGCDQFCDFGCRHQTMAPLHTKQETTKHPACQAPCPRRAPLTVQGVASGSSAIMKGCSHELNRTKRKTSKQPHVSRNPGKPM